MSKKLTEMLREMGNDEAAEREYNQQMADYCSSEPPSERGQDILDMIKKNNKAAEANERFKWYVAGFLDADGSVSLAAMGGKDKFRTPCVELYNNDLGILERIQKEFDGKISIKKAKKDTHRDSYTLTFTGNDALFLIEAVVDKMNHFKKKTRAYLINKYYKKYTPRNGKYTEDQLVKKQWLENEVMSIQMRGPEKVLDTA